MDPGSFFAELKRRHVYKVAVAYAIVAWLLIQIATSTFPVLEIPTWATRLVIALVALGFPIALIFAWAFELTPEGIKRTEDVAPGESLPRRTGRKLTAARLYHRRRSSDERTGKQMSAHAFFQGPVSINPMPRP